nr:phospholipase [Arthrobacter zhangbolii]
MVVYAVHGRGQSPDFMKDVADRVDLPDLAWVLPAAHNKSWYPQSFLAPIEDNQPELDVALETVRSHLAVLLGRDGPPVGVLGFSQGACLLSEYLLRERPPLAGAVLHTGGYLGPAPRAWPVNPDLSGLAVELLTSQDDAWVPLHRVEATALAFRSLGATVELTTYDDPEHHLNDDSIRMIRRYLRQRTSSSRSN